MEINLNDHANTPYGTFNVSKERGNLLLEHIMQLCERAFDLLPQDYTVGELFGNTADDQKIMHRLDYARIIREMVEPAQNDDEKNYMLYLSYTGIKQLEKRLMMCGNKKMGAND